MTGEPTPGPQKYSGKELVLLFEFGAVPCVLEMWDCAALWTFPSRTDCSAASPRFSNSMAYYGLAMDLQKFGLSVYLVQVLFGVIDIPAMLVATTTMVHVGRRATVASFLILAGLVVIANIFVPEGEPRLLHYCLGVSGVWGLVGNKYKGTRLRDILLDLERK